MKTSLELNESNFDSETLQTTRPVVVDFWAEWCGPCKMLAPVLEDVARELEGQAVVARVNVDDHPALAARFDVRSIPTLLYFSGGTLRDRSVGLVNRKAIVTTLNRLQLRAAGTGGV